MVDQYGDKAREVGEAATRHLLGEDEIDDLYVRLEGLYVELDDDPLLGGPKRLNGKIAQTKRVMDEVDGIYLSVGRTLHNVKRDLRVQKASLDLSMKWLFANDPEVMAGRSVSDREAMALTKLSSEWSEVQRLEGEVSDIEAVLVVIKAKRSSLRDTQTRLRDQIKLCQAEIDLGAQWGGRRRVELEPGQGFATAKDALSVNEIIESVEKEIGETNSDDIDNLIEEINLDELFS